MVFGLITALWLTRDVVRLSRPSALMLFAFLGLHAIGAHYGYAYVPYDAWIASATGISLQDVFGFQRNHYDRLVHLAFGLLLAWPIREVLLQTSPVRGRWSYLLPTALVMAASMAYEVAEWLAVLVAAPNGGGADLLGMQGDEWDSQKDMALAAAGAMLAMTIAVNLRELASARARDDRRVLHAERPQHQLASVQAKHLAGAGRPSLAQAVDERGAQIGHHVGPGVAVGGMRLGLDPARGEPVALDRPSAPDGDQHGAERRARRRARIAAERPVARVGRDDDLLRDLG